MLRPWTPRITSTQGQDASTVAHHTGREREGREGGVRGGRGGGEEEGRGGRWCEGREEKGEVEGGEGRRGRGGWCERREREGREREEGEGGRGREGRESGVRGNGKGQTDTSSKHAELLLSMRQWSSTRQVYSPSVTLPDTLSFSPVVPIGLHWRGREHTVHTWAHTDAHACTHRQTHSDTQHSPRPHAATEPCYGLHQCHLPTS